MLEKDYITRIIETFAKNIVRALHITLILENYEGVTEIETAVGEALELDPKMLFALDPESFVTMMRLGGNAEALSDYVAYSLEGLADAYREVASCSRKGGSCSFWRFSQ